MQDSKKCTLCKILTRRYEITLLTLIIFHCDVFEVYFYRYLNIQTYENRSCVAYSNTCGSFTLKKTRFKIVCTSCPNDVNF